MRGSQIGIGAFALLVTIIMTQAANNVVSKIVIGQMSIPPVGYAAVRMLVVAVLAAPWLMPAPRKWGRVIILALLLGGPQHALLFLGLQHTSPSVAAITLQIGMPISAVLAMFFLKERVSTQRWIGVFCTFCGAALVSWKSGELALAPGAIFFVLAALAGASGAVLLRTVPDVPPLQLQAWVGFAGFIPLSFLSALTEEHQVDSMIAAGWPFLACLLFAAIVVSILAHTINFWLMQRHEASLMAPLTVMNPLFTMMLGTALTGDVIDLRVGLGALSAVLGILIVTVRIPSRLTPARRAPKT